MAEEIELKTETPDTSVDLNGYIVGADSQSAASPSLWQIATVWAYLRGLANTWTGLQTFSGGVDFATAPTIDGDTLLTEVTGYTRQAADAAFQPLDAVLTGTTASFTTADETKLDAIEVGATADQTGAEIKTAYEAEADTNAFTDAEQSKLSGIEAGADVTDAANVTAAGALMDSEVDANLKTLVLPAGTTISSFGKTLIGAADAAASRTALSIYSEAEVDALFAGLPSENITKVATRTALKALDTGTIDTAYLTESSRDGWWEYKTGDFSALVAADTQEGLFMAADGIATSVGAWARSYVFAIEAPWFELPTDGTTDSATAINAALLMAYTIGGGLVRIPAGTFAHTVPITVYSDTMLVGAGQDATTLFLTAGSNCASVIAIDPSENITTTAHITALFGSNDVSTPEHFAIEHLCVDGNQANQSASASPQYQCGLLCYANSYTLRDVRFQNIYGRGIMSEWASSGEAEPSMGTHWIDVTVDKCNRDGIHYNGPHDAHWSEVVVVDSGTGTDDTYDAFYIGTKGNGRFFNLHAWARSTTTNFPRYGLNLESQGCEVTTSHFEGVNRPVRINGYSNRFVECNMYSCRAVDADGTPYFLTVAGDGNRISGIISNTSGNSDAMGIHLGADHGLGGGFAYARGCYINVHARNLTDQLIVVSSDGGNNDIYINGNSSTGTWTDADIHSESFDETTDVVIKHEATPTVDYNRRLRRGLWTPQVTFATPGDFSPTYDYQYGWYTKNGQMVDFIVRVQFDTNAYTTASGAFRVLFNDLPYTPNSSALCGLVRTANAGAPITGTNMSISTNGSDYLYFQSQGTAGVATWSPTQIPASTNNILIEISGRYMTDE